MTALDSVSAIQASFSNARPVWQTSSGNSVFGVRTAPKEPLLKVLGDQVFLNRADPAPLYFQLACGIEKLVQEGRLSSGDRLPAAARLASQFRITPGTVHSALVYLENKGVIRIEPRRGTYVR